MQSVTMLEDLLQTVAEGGIHSYDDLSERLAISQAMLEAMLEDLARNGYLRAVGIECEGHCSGCAVGGCSVAGPGCLWTLTEKGARAATQIAG
jgi:Mn-dependent DtxR family transcriptional regulator